MYDHGVSIDCFFLDFHLSFPALIPFFPELDRLGRQPETLSTNLENARCNIADVSTLRLQGEPFSPSLACIVYTASGNRFFLESPRGDHREIKNRGPKIQARGGRKTTSAPFPRPLRNQEIKTVLVLVGSSRTRGL